MQLLEAEAWLEGLINLERAPDLRHARLSLGPVQRLLAAVGHPERRLRVVHVAGSKGKGSTALLAEALLGEAGVTTATFTSPHLERWTERFRIDGREIPPPALAAVLTRLRPHVDALRSGPEPPSFFDATTAAAFCLFADAGVDAALIEVGLGGRLDSTNVVAPAVCCITSVELEHREKLGDTLAAIAGEKAGIAKPGVPLVSGALAPEAADVVAERAAQLACPLARLGQEIAFDVLAEDIDRTRFRYAEGALAFEVELVAPGRHQAANAALALACVARLGVIEPASLEGIAQRAFSRVALPGRIELLSRKPWIVVDGAHTAASARALAATLARIPRRASHLVLSVSAGKDLGAICTALAPQADRVTVTRAEPVRSLDPGVVADALRAVGGGAEVCVVPNPHLALRAARAALPDDGLLCASGSFYLAGIARRVLGEPAAGDRTPGPAPRP